MNLQSSLLITSITKPGRPSDKQKVIPAGHTCNRIGHWLMARDYFRRRCDGKFRNEKGKENEGKSRVN